MNFKRFRKLLKKNSDLITFSSIFLALIGIALTLWQVNQAVYESEYPKLNVTQSIDKNYSRINITITNEAKRKETGTIYIYKLELDDKTPHTWLKSLEPGQSANLSFAINTTYIPLQDKGNSTAAHGRVNIPGELYYVSETESISYKITCDNCHSQGIIKRIPDYDQFEVETRIQYVNGTFRAEGFVPIYSWVTFDKESLAE